MTNTNQSALLAALRKVTNGAILAAAALLFVAPNLVFAANFKGAIAWEVMGAAATAGWLLVRRPGARRSPLLGAPIDIGTLAVCFALGVALVVLGGEGHLVYANPDWFWRDAVLADLIRSAGLPHYQVSGALYALRAPLGFYMVPALVGRGFGLGAGHAALVLQNSLILGLILYGFSLLMPRRRTLRLILLIAFSGLDIVGTLMLHKHGWTLNPIDLPSHINAWTLWQYSSQITQIFWVPNHALPGWWLALLILLCAQGEVSLGYLGLAVAVTFFWAPLPALGATPFLVALFLKDARRTVLDPWLWVHFLAALLFLPFAIYLVIGADQIAHSLMPHTALWLLSFALFQFLELPLAICVLINWKNNPRALNLPAVVAVLCLLILPVVVFGPADDLVMRGSIPALTILAFLASALPVGGPGVRPDLRIAATALAALAAVTGGFEVARVLVFPRYAISDCDFMTVQRTFDTLPPPSHYLVRNDAIPDWLLTAPAGGSVIVPRLRRCWPDYPFDPTFRLDLHTTRELLDSERLRHLRTH